jgi:uracil-DNA glycosylase family 4
MVGPEGSTEAKLVLVGEAPGAWEEQAGRPFVGPSGKLLERWWRKVGLHRSDFYITNVVKRRPPANDITKIPPPELEASQASLIEELSGLNPNVIIPTGNTALKALTGKVGITDWRGSILLDEGGRKVIPTIHPAGVIRNTAWTARCLADWTRIKDESAFPERRIPERQAILYPSASDLRDFLYEADSNPYLSIDIETSRDGRIICVGFAYSPDLGISIPFDTVRHQQVVEQLCQLQGPQKVLQNGLFDAFWLASEGIEISNWIWDTMCLHAVLEPTEEHGLGFLASIYTKEPFYKREGKTALAGVQQAQEALFRYNVTDACVTLEVFHALRSRMSPEQLRFYADHYVSLYPVLLDMMCHGISVDEDRRKRRLADLMVEIIEVEDRLTALAGRPLHVKKALSGKKLAEFIYEDLGLPKRMTPPSPKTGKRTLITDEAQIRSLIQRFPERFAEVGNLILSHRRAHKLSTFYSETRVDDDGRMRCSYRPVTEAGRLSSSRHPMGGGGNLQNIDREARDIFVPDHPKWLFLEADLSQVESRIVYMLTRDPALIEIARAPSWEHDDHRAVAVTLFGVPAAAITKEQRYLAKRVNHAAQRDMGAKRLSQILLNEGYARSVKQCEELLRRYFDARPAVRDWQKKIRFHVMQHRSLTNSWGRHIAWPYDRLAPELYKKAYSFLPQSEAADLMLRWGLIPTWKYLRGRRGNLNATVHDSLLVSCPPEGLYDLMVFVRQSLERPRSYAGQELTVPVEFSIGTRWGGAEKHEFKRFPSRDLVEATARKLLKEA